MSVGHDNFNKSKKFVLTLARSMKIAPEGSHLGLIVYSFKPSVLVRFNEDEKQNIPVINGILKQYTRLGGKTYTDKAINKSATDLFTLEGGERPEKPDILVVLTDGRTNVNSEPYEKVLQPLKVYIFKVP